MSEHNYRQKPPPAEFAEEFAAFVGMQPREEIEAVQWRGDNLAEIQAVFPEARAMLSWRRGGPVVLIDGRSWGARVGDWVLRTGGVLYVMYPGHFADRYERKDVAA